MTQRKKIGTAGIMDGHREKRNKRIDWAVLLIVLAAATLTKAEGLPEYPLQMLYTGRTFFYISVIIAWGISVHRRIIRTSTRRLFLAIAVMMALWLSLRTAKYDYFQDPGILRYIWYSYYIFFLFLPVFCLLAAMYLGRPEDYRLPGHLRLPLLVSALLLLLVLTNDAHQLVFAFPEGILPWSDKHYSYGPGYYVSALWSAGCMLAAVFMMVQKCRQPARHSLIWQPLVPLGLLFVYIIFYVADFPRLSQFLNTDITAVFCMLGICTLEACIESGLLQSNTGYGELFENGDLRARITDAAGNTVYRSAGARPLEPGQIREVMEKEEIQPDPDTVLRSHPVNGGFVLWETDISELRQVLEELEENQENLKDRVLLEEEQYKTGVRIAELKESNRLYDLLQKETSREIRMLREMLKEYEEDPAAGASLLPEIAVLCAYVKRRGNLVLIGERSQRIDIRDLQLCFAESLSNLELTGAECAMDLPKEGSLKLSDALRFYEFFENKVETALGHLQALFLKMKQESGKTVLILEMETGEGDEDLAHFSLQIADRENAVTGGAG